MRGKLNKRPVKVGDNIAEGELIASLDPRDFRSDVVKQERICNMHMQISIVQKS
ncbi:MAG: hypothetical protein KAR12_13305 [Methylococcales bacterium]|nr:hypothetical protein [Methylococcales bacterium]